MDAASTPSSGQPCKHKYKQSTMGCGITRDRAYHMVTLCDPLAEWIMAGSTLFHFPNRKQTTGGLDSGHTAEPTLGISLLSVFKYPSYLVFVNYFLKCTEFGLKTNHQNGSQQNLKLGGGAIGSSDTAIPG